MKPHEETLEVPVEDARCAVRSGTGEVVADIREPLHLSGCEFGRLFAAAPEMATELLDAVRSFRSGYRITEAQIRGMERVLAKAGAL